MRIKQIIDEENSLFEDNTVRISDEMKDIVSRMLTIDPEKRIDWGDLF
jgi:serine/threonine protein kinase